MECCNVFAQSIIPLNCLVNTIQPLLTSFNILNLSVLLVDEFLDYGETDLFVFCLYFRWHCSWLITSYIRKYPKHMNLLLQGKIL